MSKKTALEKNRTRVNFTMPDRMIDFYQEMADELSIPRSTAMIMALNQYMDQRKSIDMGDVLQSLASKLEEDEEKGAK